MNSALETAERQRKEARSRLPGHALSVSQVKLPIEQLGKQEVIALSSNEPPRIDETGIVYFSAPVFALTRENLVGQVRIADEKNYLSVSGDSFHPLITERDSNLYKEHEAFMARVVVDPHWRDKPMPGRDLNARRLTPEEEHAWAKFNHRAKLVPPEGKEHWRGIQRV